MFDYIKEINKAKKFVEHFKFNGLLPVNKYWRYIQESNSDYSVVKYKCDENLSVHSKFPHSINITDNLDTKTYELYYKNLYGAIKKISFLQFKDENDFSSVEIHCSGMIIKINEKGVYFDDFMVFNPGPDYNKYDTKVFILEYFYDEYLKNSTFDNLFKTHFDEDSLLEKDKEKLLRIRPELIKYFHDIPNWFVKLHKNDTKLVKAGIEI